jgi:hypothetical protein
MIADGYSPLSQTEWRATGKRRFIVHYLDEQLRQMAKDGHSLAIRAVSREQAVVFLFGAPADRWDGNCFWKWTDRQDGGLKCRIEEVTV